MVDFRTISRSFTNFSPSFVGQFLVWFRPVFVWFRSNFVLFLFLVYFKPNSDQVWFIFVRITFTKVLIYFQKCLDKDPAKRYTCEQLLNHAFFKNFTFKFPETELEEFERLRRVRYRYEQKALVSVSVFLHLQCILDQKLTRFRNWVMTH